MAGYADSACTDAPVLIAANALQVRLLLAHLTLALTFCRVARTVETEPCTKPEPCTSRILGNAHSALFLAMTSIFRLQTTHEELQEITAKLDLLKVALQDFARHVARS